MCFSATASFVTAAALVPVGVVSIALAYRRDPARCLPLALVPLLFASQQALEGLVWIGLQSSAPGAGLHLAALAYLGYAFALWPLWIPWSALRLAAGKLHWWQRRLFRALWGLGAVLAGSLWIPLLLKPSLIHPVVRHGSIDYQALPPWTEWVGYLPTRLGYALIIVLPLLLHPYQRLRWLGVALVVAFALTQLAYLHAFSSVWCYFSALLSTLVLWVLREEGAATGSVTTDIQ